MERRKRKFSSPTTTTLMHQTKLESWVEEKNVDNFFFVDTPTQSNTNRNSPVKERNLSNIGIFFGEKKFHPHTPRQKKLPISHRHLDFHQGNLF